MSIVSKKELDELKELLSECELEPCDTCGHLDIELEECHTTNIHGETVHVVSVICRHCRAAKS